MGYFSELMAFTFLQLVPLELPQFYIQLEAMGVGMLCFFLAILYENYIYHQRFSSLELKQQAFWYMGDVLNDKLEGQDISLKIQDLYQLQHSFYEEASRKKKASYIVSTEGKLSYLYGVLLQRIIYLLSHLTSDELKNSPQLKHDLFQVSRLFDQAAKAHTQDYEKILKQLQSWEENHPQTDWVYSSLDSIVSVLSLVLTYLSDDQKNKLDENWKIPFLMRVKRCLRFRVKLDAFELRFALRMCVILVIGMSYNQCFNAEHGFWFVMNAFLLTQPMMEESLRRMKTRFIGTVCGSLLMVFLTMFFEGTSFHIIFATILTFGVFSAIPGTWLHALFVTCFSLSITTLALNVYIAVQLRIFYVVVAIVFVLIVSLLVLPINISTQIRYNEQLLFHMHHMYLRLLKKSLYSHVDYWKLCDAEIHYHLVHDQLKKSLENNASHVSIERDILHISYHMVSEIEQMLFIINHKEKDPLLYNTLISYIQMADHLLTKIQGQLHKNETSDDQEAYWRFQEELPQAPHLSKLMERYVDHLVILYDKVYKLSS